LMWFIIIFFVFSFFLQFFWLGSESEIGKWDLVTMAKNTHFPRLLVARVRVTHAPPQIGPHLNPEFAPFSTPPVSLSPSLPPLPDSFHSVSRSTPHHSTPLPASFIVPSFPCSLLPPTKVEALCCFHCPASRDSLWRICRLGLLTFFDPKEVIPFNQP